MAASPATTLSVRPGRPSLLGHLQIARVDHWVKNVFVLPGVIVALSVDRARWVSWSWITFVLGMLAVCLIASSNYVINEILDAPSDLLHPVKNTRPVPAGRVSIPWAYVQWIALLAAGLLLALHVSTLFTLTLLALWIMGCLYNIPPVRSKDLPYLDVLSEAINNPLRMLAGWYLAGTTMIAPASLLVSYWMVGCYFMAIKRFAEFRDIGDHHRSASYRKSFGFYNEQRLLVSIMFYGSQAMLFFGAFIMRYRLELVLAFPLVALVMALYLSLAFKPDSAVQRPEGLYREPALMGAVVSCTVVMAVLLFVNISVLHRIFRPTVPWNSN
ncbi:MAG TPA: UbiA family prenyltransferase [Candidatus Sulfotelmatobacter sp.]|nr:UbiA family prenyltransferase [Candidatus Sulfotelmatobacter sp.]